MATLPPPPPSTQVLDSRQFRDWLYSVFQYVQTSGGSLGTIATQNYNNVYITGGSISDVLLSGVTIPYTDVTGLATVAHTGAYSDLTGKPTGYTGTITTAKLTTGGTNGSMTFTNGILTAQTQAT